jgi:hypothetical protein
MRSGNISYLSFRYYQSSATGSLCQAPVTHTHARTHTRKVHLFYEPGYVISCVANLTEKNSSISIYEFPNGAVIIELCPKRYLVTNFYVTDYVTNDDAPHSNSKWSIHNTLATVPILLHDFHHNKIQRN